ncbi:MAG TPA: tetratricopeptide repeat protein, partial [Gemmatimonadaceae bacterium]|nr:tetratricopeptide repeat protein [Gemmatimonadaceae bacterium]
ISRRLGRLSGKSQSVLTTAAVIGREFDVDLAIEAGAGDEDEMLDAVDEGVKASVLQSSGERGGDRYQFTHRLLAEVLRTAANPRRLKKIHERVARAMEELTPDAITEIATHFDRAGEQAGALRYALVAAEQARKVYAHNEATEWLRIAERNATTPAELADVRVRLATIAEAVGRYQEAEELCHLAIDWFAGQGDRRQELAIRLMRERVRNLLGQPARQTLEACLVLDREMRELGAQADADRVQLLRMLSMTYERLGDHLRGKEAAREGAELAERVGDPYLKATALNRVGATLLADDPMQAADYHRRALEIYATMGDVRGQAETHNNLGIVYTLRGDWEQAQGELRAAMQLARTAGAPDLTGVLGLNLGVVYLKSGDYDRARELFGEALALFAAVRSSARQLFALYNLAHLDRERGQLEAAAELYEITASLAQRVGHSDVEIGAMAGAGLASLAKGQLDAARVAWQASEERVKQRADWFQGRELVAALGVRVLAADGNASKALDHFEQARTLAEANDFYSAAWLALECAEALLMHDPAQIRATLDRYRERVKAAGYTELDRRYGEMLVRTEGQVVRSQ